MPIYEYRCGKCGGVIEKIQKFSDPPLKKHAGCGGSLTKLISQSSFQLKGSGWYVTDYAGKGKSDGNGEKPAGDGKETKETKGDSDGSKSGDKPKDTKNEPSKKKTGTKS